jgi:hypothetical protein
MAASASAPPDDEKSLGLDDPEDPEDPEMTSIMDAEQRRELQRAARLEAARVKEPERETARPPAAATALAAEELTQIPKAAAIPMEARPQPVAPAPQAVEKPVAGPSTWMVVAFVLLAAAVVFALRS